MDCLVVIFVVYMPLFVMPVLLQTPLVFSIVDEMYFGMRVSAKTGTTWIMGALSDQNS